MNNPEFLDKVRRTFANDRFATEVTGIVITDVAENYAKCELSVESRHCNALGAVMGGAIFTLADFCFAVAANAIELSTVSVTSSINYLNAARCSKLIAEAKCLKTGKRTCFFRINVVDEHGNAVAEVTTTGCRIN